MKRRHKTILICCIIYALSFSLTALAFPVPKSVSKNTLSQTVTLPAQESHTAPPEEDAAAFSSEVRSAPEKAQSVWRLAEISGSIRVMHDSECVLVTAIDPSTLRSADRLLLQQGVAASSLEEILMLIEDLGS